MYKPYSSVIFFAVIGYLSLYGAADKNAAKRNSWPESKSYPSVYDMACHPKNPELLATAGNEAVKIWDVTEGKLTSQIFHIDFDEEDICPCCVDLDPVSSVAWDREGGKIVSGGGPCLKIWDIEKRHCLSRGEFSDGVSSICYSKDGNLMSVVLYSGVIHIFDVRQQPTTNIFSDYVGGENETIQNCDFSPDHTQLAVAGYDLHVLDLRTKKSRIYDIDTLDVQRKNSGKNRYLHPYCKSVSWSDTCFLVATEAEVKAKRGDKVRSFVKPSKEYNSEKKLTSNKEPRIAVENGDRVVIAYNQQVGPRYSSLVAFLDATRSGKDAIAGTKQLNPKDEKSVCWITNMEFNADGKRVAISDSKGRIRSVLVDPIYDEVDRARRRPYAYSFSEPSQRKKTLLKLLRRTKSNLS